MRHVKQCEECCSLGSAERLKELGVEQVSLNWYVEFPGQKGMVLGEWLVKAYSDNVARCSAYTVCELGKMLPVYVHQDRFVYEIDLGFEDEEYGLDVNQEPTVLLSPRLYSLGYRSMRTDRLLNDMIIRFDNEAEVRARMLIYLLENKLFHIEPKKD